MPDTDLILAALVRAADVIAHLPVHQQEVSDRADMLALSRGEDTGRDGLIIAKALAYAIAAGDALPKNQRAEMAWLLRDIAHRGAAPVLDICRAVRTNTGRSPDLGPEINALVERRWNQHVADVGLHDEMREGPTLH